MPGNSRERHTGWSSNECEKYMDCTTREVQARELSKQVVVISIYSVQ